MSMKAEIDALCKDLMLNGGGVSAVAPIVLMVYLGNETYNVVNASLKDAFTTSFQIEPEIYDIRITDSKMSYDEISTQFTDILGGILEQRVMLNDLRFTYVALMDDPIFDENALNLAKTICDVMNNLNDEIMDYNATIQQTSFYGIFRAKMRMRSKEIYPVAFSFVNNGKSIWKNIYHMEIPSLEKSISKYTRTIAIHNMSDRYTMVQDNENKTESDGYSWKSVYAHCLKVPELIVAKLLQKIYTEQVSGNHIDQSEWEKNVDQELEDVFERFLGKREYDCEQYIPLEYNVSPQPEQKKNLFGRGSNVVQKTTYSSIIVDEISLQQILDDLYGTVELCEQDYKYIMEQIISAASAIDNNPVNVSNQIQQFLEKHITEYISELERCRSEAKFKDTFSNNVSVYVNEVYTKKKTVLILEKKIEFVKNLLEQLTKRNYLSQMIQNIVDKNSEFTKALNELILNEYGGILTDTEFDLTKFPVFTVNESQESILKKIGHVTLSELTRDKIIISGILKDFMDRTLSTLNMSKGHNLGQANGNYHSMETIRAALAVSTRQVHDEDLLEVFELYPSAPPLENDLFRENAFYVITSRLYSSDNYIVRYKEV